MAYIEPHNQPKTRATPKTEYDVLTEAAWHVLSPFVDTRDFNVLLPELDPVTREVMRDKRGRMVAGSKPKNQNTHWRHAYVGANVTFNKDGKIVEASEDDLFDEDAVVGTCRFHRITKRHMSQHLKGEMIQGTDIRTVLYYRSAANATFRLGHGTRVKSPRLARTTFAKLLRVPQGVVESKNYNAVLWGIDIDFKPVRYPEGTRNDASEVRDWIVSDHFPGAYSEPSTSGRGIHIYIKLAYPNGGNVAQTHARILTKLKACLARLDATRSKRGYVANVDAAVCGVPSCVKFDDRGRFTGITRSQCIKLPNFDSGYNTFRRLRNVSRFHTAPVFFLNAIDNVLQPHTNASTATAALSVDLIDALTPQGSAVTKDETDLLIEQWLKLGEQGWDEVGVRPRRKRARTFDAAVEMERIRNTLEAKERCRLFYRLINRIENTVVTPERINELYVEHNLNRTDNTTRRMDLWKSMETYFKKKFRPADNRMPHMSGFATHRAAIMAEIEKRIDTTKLLYVKNKGGGRKVVKKVTVEELAAVQYVIETIHETYGTAYLGYADAAVLLKQMTGRSASPNKVACIFKNLAGTYLQVEEKGSWDSGRATIYVPLVRTKAACVPKG